MMNSGSIVISFQNIIGKTMVHDFKDYKKAKLYVEHLSDILKIVNLSIRGLDLYEVYHPVHEILRTLKTQKVVLNSHFQEQKKILSNKGNKE